MTTKPNTPNATTGATPKAAPSASARAAQATQTVEALVPVNYCHSQVLPGDVFEVREQDLAQLLEVGAVKVLDTQAA
jgi:hypothetical protein